MTLRVDHDFSPSLNLHTIARWANYPRRRKSPSRRSARTRQRAFRLAALSRPSRRLPITHRRFAPIHPTRRLTKSRRSTAIRFRSRASKAISGIRPKSRPDSGVHGVRNALVAGAEGGQEISNPIRYSYTINKINTVPSTTLLDPDEHQAFAGTPYITSVAHTKAKSVGVYFVDTMKLGRFFELSGGVRWDRFDTGYNLYQPAPPPPGGTATATVPPISRIDEQPSYRAAFVYKPSTRGSIYFDYGTSFNPAAESLSLSVGLANASAAPEENETYEAGAKWSFLNERLLMEGAWFRTEKDNARRDRSDQLQQHRRRWQPASERRAIQRGGSAA